MDYPVEVTAALRRLQGGAGTDADRQILSDFVNQNLSTLPAQDLITLRMAIMGATGTTAEGPLRASETPQFIPPTPPTDWRSLVEGWGNGLGQTVAQGAYGTPTPVVSPSTDRGMNLPPLDVNAPDRSPYIKAGSEIGGQGHAPDIPGFNLDFMQGPTQQIAMDAFGVTPPGTPTGANPVAPTYGSGSAADRQAQWLADHPQSTVPGFGGDVPSPGLGGTLMSRAEREAEQNKRRAARGSSPDAGGRENWKKIAFGIDPSSAFAGVNSEAAQYYTQHPDLAALRLAKGDSAAAGMMTPEVAGALQLAQLGVLGGKGKGLSSGPSSNIGQLKLAEDLVGQLGPGQFVDPQKTYKKAFRMVQRTPGEQMFAGESGQQGDIGNQIDVTNAALANSAAAWMNEDGIRALSNHLNYAAQQWLMAKSTGDTDMTYPQYLKSIGAQRWVAPSIV